MNSLEKKMSEGRHLTKNVFYSLLGQTIPLLAALYAIPILLTGLGIDRFGIFNLVWIVVGYFSLFDFGIARAMTKIVAEKLGNGLDKEIPGIFWTGLYLMMTLGIIGTLLLSLSSSYLARVSLSVPQALVRETTMVLYLLSLSIPIAITTACLSGVLQAYQRFDLINSLRILIGTTSFLGPMIVMQFSKSLILITVVLVILKLIELLLYFKLCFRVNPDLYYKIGVRYALIFPLINFGSWITVSNIIGPLVAYTDRFLISTTISIASLVYYVVPYEFLMRLMIIPGAIVGVLFPVFSSGITSDKKNVEKLFISGLKYTYLVMFPILLIVVTFGNKGLDLWLGYEFASKSKQVLQLFAIGGLLQSVSYVPYALVQATGRPDLTAKLHLMGAPLYLIGLLWLTRKFGIEGAAIAWIMRVTVDVVVLMIMAKRLLIPNKSIKYAVSTILGSIMVLLIPTITPMRTIETIAFDSIVLLSFVIISWLKILNSEDRNILRCFIGDITSIFKKRPT